MKGSPRPLARWCALAAAVCGAGVLAACSSGGSAIGSSTTAVASAPFGPSASIVPPTTLPDGSFPSVTEPTRDGSLRDVRLSVTPVGTAEAPTALVARPGHPDQLFIAERAGRIVLARTGSPDGLLRIDPSPLLDLSRDVGTEVERGLLGLAFDRTGNVLYANYTRRNGDTRVVAVAVTDPGGSPTLGERRTVLEVDQPAPNHNGGDLQLGPDGYLYIGLGDGGGQGDPSQTAQNLHSLLGKMLRIDPTHPTATKGYAIPKDNPYAPGDAGAPEIWLSGLRNPWRYAFDPANGDLWIGDVGESELEEVDRLPADAAGGANLGWSGFEGTHVFKDGRAPGPTVPPLFEVSHDDGVCAITGGVVYRGTRLRGLDGAYLFSDLCRPGVHGLTATRPSDRVGTVTDERLLAGTGKADQIISFGTDAAGEVYVLSLDGTIDRLDPAT